MTYNKADLFRAVSRIESAIMGLEARDGCGVRSISAVELSTHIEDMETVVSGLEKQTLGVHFLRMQNELPPRKFMWASAIDDQGRTVAVTAVRLDDTGEEWSLKRLLMERMRRLVPAKGGGFAELADHTSEFASQVHGRCIYMGDTFVDADWRTNRLSTLLTHYLALLAWNEWKPTILHGWIRKHHAETGMALKWGFTEVYGPGMMWKVEPEDPTWIDTCFVAMREDSVALLIHNALIEHPGFPSKNSE